MRNLLFPVGTYILFTIGEYSDQQNTVLVLVKRVVDLGVLAARVLSTLRKEHPKIPSTVWRLPKGPVMVDQVEVLRARIPAFYAALAPFVEELKFQEVHEEMDVFQEEETK